MDPKDHPLQSIGFCNWLYNFLIKTPLKHAFKTVTLGYPIRRNSAKVQNGSVYDSDEMVLGKGQEEAPGETARQSNGGNDSDQKSSVRLPSNATRTQPPLKKVVSINDQVEVIDTSKKRITRKKSNERSASAVQDEPRPLRSILKKTQVLIN